MQYISKRDKIKNIIDKLIIPAIKEKDLDFSLVVDNVSKEVGCSREMVIDVLDSYIQSKEIDEIRILTIPKDKIDSWLEIQRKKQIEINKEISEAGL